MTDDELVKGVAMLLLHEGAHGGNPRTPAINARAMRIVDSLAPVAHLRSMLRSVQMAEISDDARMHLRLFQDRDFLKKMG